MIENYIVPRFGDVLIRRLRPEHLEALYQELLTKGSPAGGRPLAPKTVYDVHVVLRSGLNDATRRHYVTENVALIARAPRPQTQARTGPETWTADQLRTFLERTRHLRLHPAVYVVAMTGMRRGEVAGLRWGDWQTHTHGLSIARARQVAAGCSVEVPCKTKRSRRCVDLDPTTEQILGRWKRRQNRDGHPVGYDDPMFTNNLGLPLHPESISQLFERQLARVGVPKIRFHDLRHTHASLLVAAGTPIKVVSERLGHANPGFTMATYQHLIPGMTSQAAIDFDNLIHPEHRNNGKPKTAPNSTPYDATIRTTGPDAAGRDLPTRTRITPGHSPIRRPDGRRPGRHTS